MALAASERTLGELLRELSSEASHLFRQEVQLAKAEMSEKAAHVGSNVGKVALGGGVALLGGLVLLYALVTGVTALLETFMPLEIAVWLAPLIVGGALAAFGWSRIQSGLEELRKESLAPRRTAHTLEENKAWLKSKVQ